MNIGTRVYAIAMLNGGHKYDTIHVRWMDG